MARRLNPLSVSDRVIVLGRGNDVLIAVSVQVGGMDIPRARRRRSDDMLAAEEPATQVLEPRDFAVECRSVEDVSVTVAVEIDRVHVQGAVGLRTQDLLRAIRAVPKDPKASALLRGRYEGADEIVQIVYPSGRASCSAGSPRRAPRGRCPGRSRR